MKQIAFLPQPKQVRSHQGTGPHQHVPIRQTVDKSLKRPGEYRLTLSPDDIHLAGHNNAALQTGMRTLKQMTQQLPPSGRFPCMTIHDWPDIPERGVYYDVCRGRVPTRESLIKQIDLLAQFKINHYQLYIEHTFRFQKHPDIGKGASPLTAKDIVALDKHCQSRLIELVPSLACFGHLDKILSLPQYRHMAEDLGVGEYKDIERMEKMPAWQKHKAWSLSPACPETYIFLDSLFEEFLPLFSSDRFNVCCDETWDLGLGQSYDLCKEKGQGRVYLDHLLKLRELAAKYGKKIMFWGDIIRHYPELIHDIPSDVTVLDWAYTYRHNFDSLADFKKADRPFFACPGTNSWNALFPRLPEAYANIHGFAKAARDCGAAGLLNTDWGDGGHYNFMEYSWPAYLFGAEQAWNVDADQTTFSKRFCKLMFGTDKTDLPKAMDQLGETALLFLNENSSIWPRLLFAPAGDPIFDGTTHACRESIRGKIELGKVRFDPKWAQKQLKLLDRIRAVFVKHATIKDQDLHGLLPYWIFAVDTLRCAANKVLVLGPDGSNSAASRRTLRTELSTLVKRFQKLWNDRNRPSEIGITLNRYKAVIESLK